MIFIIVSKQHFFVTAKANMTETHSSTSQMTSRLTWNKFSKCQ